MPGSHPEGTARVGGHPPAWTLERLAFERGAAPAASVAHLEACSECRAAAERLRAERDAFLESRPTARFLARVTLRAEELEAARRRSWSPRRWFLATGLAAAATGAALFAGLKLSSREPVRFKGDGAPSFVLFVARGAEPARPLDPAEALRPGDVLRFGVVSPRSAHAVVASIDSAGRFSRYYPAGGEGSAPLDGREYLQILPGSVVLDDTLGREWIALVISATPVEQRRVEEALRRAYSERRGGELGPVDLDGQVAVIPVAKVKP